MSGAQPTPGPTMVKEAYGGFHIRSTNDRYPVNRKIATVPREQDAQLYAAATGAAHELPDEYDPVEVQKALPALIHAMELALETLSAPASAEARINDTGNTLRTALAKARGDDA